MSLWTRMPIMTLARAVEARLRPPFRGIRPDAARRAKLLAAPPARQTLAILFTPRSGSSRLSEILAATGRLGRAGESFNPQAMAANARAWGADGLDIYLDLLRRQHARGGVFSVEMTFGHLRGAFGDPARAVGLLRPDAWVWLIREDIVAQAVSASRMVQTRVSHDTGQAGLETADDGFRYHAWQIRHYINTLRWHEYGTELLVAGSGLRPLRLSYERLLPLPPAAIAALIADGLGVTLPEDIALPTTHRKLGTDRNTAFAQRFRAEHPRLMARLDRDRASLLGALAPLQAPAHDGRPTSQER